MPYDIEYSHYNNYEIKELPIIGVYANDYSQRMEVLTHGSHIDNSIKIIDKGIINPLPIPDRAISDKKAINGVWLSLNTWNNNWSIYGNIHFCFNSYNYLFNKNIYWIGIKNTNPKACIFLVTKKTYDCFESYNIETSNGPLRYLRERNELFYNNNFNIELIFENEFSLDDIIGHDIRNHHPDYCNLKINNCIDKSLNIFESGLKFYSCLLLLDKCDIMKILTNGKLHSEFERYLSYLIVNATKLFKSDNNVILNSINNYSIELIMQDYGKMDIKEANNKISKYRNYKEYENSLILFLSSKLRISVNDMSIIFNNL